MALMEYYVTKIVGRPMELAQLKEFLHATINGKGNTVSISGEAGIGKTRLVKELEAYAEPLNVTVLECRCLYASSTPFLSIDSLAHEHFNSVALTYSPHKLYGSSRT